MTLGRNYGRNVHQQFTGPLAPFPHTPSFFRFDLRTSGSERGHRRGETGTLEPVWEGYGLCVKRGHFGPMIRDGWRVLTTSRGLRFSHLLIQLFSLNSQKGYDHRQETSRETSVPDPSLYPVHLLTSGLIFTEGQTTHWNYHRSLTTREPGE